MGYYRTNNSIKKYTLKKREKGATLIFALATAIVVLIVLGGIYYMMTKVFRISEDIKVYKSTREATASGVNYAATLINQNKFNLQLGSCAQNPIKIKFKLSNDPNLYETVVSVCFIGYEIPPGYEVTGVVYTKPISGGKGKVYSITAISTGPNNTKSIIEASYKK
ncbi:hypothetical protein [Sulfurihydrogenibium azorense]|uniref:hypothetical protein n=1 Tax=Sulfurihydrogenibium azorense TaxID=309806 RepID=UPI0024098A9E|nr:hypothetical protein [Sulfurihydrogenibium azorense]MDM7273175.1 hypothetical protein [Sulfurihydrogenibium azorense]